MWSSVGKKRNPGEWMMFPSTVNAYYNPTGNEVGVQQLARAESCSRLYARPSDRIPCWDFAAAVLLSGLADVSELCFVRRCGGSRVDARFRQASFVSSIGPTAKANRAIVAPDGCTTSTAS